MIEIIRTTERFIIPATHLEKLVFLFLHMYLYSKSYTHKPKSNQTQKVEIEKNYEILLKVKKSVFAETLSGSHFSIQNSNSAAQPCWQGQLRVESVTFLFEEIGKYSNLLQLPSPS